MHKRRVPRPSRVRCERAGLLGAVRREGRVYPMPSPARRTEEYGLSDSPLADASDCAVDSRGRVPRSSRTLA